jgi:ribonucleotide monophosphatase NagD (HAD superfamily)
MSDVGAGQRAGCRTVLVRSGAHAAPPIVSPDPVGPEVRPDHKAADLAGATDWMVEHRP